MSNRPHRRQQRHHDREAVDQVLSSCEQAVFPAKPRPLVLNGETVPGWRVYQFGLIYSLVPDFDDLSFEAREGWELRAKAVLDQGCECGAGLAMMMDGRKVVSATPAHTEDCPAMHPAVLEVMRSFTGDEP